MDEKASRQITLGACSPDPAPFEVDVDVLRRLASEGLEPQCIVDIGASTGSWARAAYAAFPEAELHLFEPLANHHPRYQRELADLLASPEIHAYIHPVALADVTGTAMLRMTDDPVSSSLLPPGISSYFTEEVEVPLVTLDSFWSEHGLPPAGLIKMDTQGAELRILRGGEQMLGAVNAIITELWAWPAYGPPTPIASQVAHWLLGQGFYLGEFGEEFRDDEGHLVAFDAIFTRPPLRVKRSAA